jgi:putative ABC transport system substrate-binding protein
MTTRRRLAIAGLAWLLIAAPLAAAAQAPHRPWRLGVLRLDAPPAAATESEQVRQLRDGLRDLGYVEGRDLVVEVRWARSAPSRLRPLAAELVALPADVIVTHGPAGVRAVQAETSTIPIVMARMDDVDAHGIVANLARPDGNVTGVSFQTGELSTKWLQLVREVVPRAAAVGVLWDANGTANQLRSIQGAARSLDVQLHVGEVRGPGDLEPAIAAVRRAGADALVMLASPLMTTHLPRLAELAARHRLPAIYYTARFVTAGGLLAYGPSETEFSWRRAASFVDRLLKGARPGDLPIEQPTKFDLVVNLKVARALGLTIPPSLVARADQVVR